MWWGNVVSNVVEIGDRVLHLSLFSLLRTDYIREAVKHVCLSQPLLPASCLETTLGIGATFSKREPAR
jgi:hypothetical protein